MKLELKSTNGTDALSIEWQRTTGTIVGRDAGRVLAMIEAAEQRGSIRTLPYPSGGIAVTKPIARSLTLMAALLGEYYQLPEALQRHYPSTPDPEETELELVH